MGNIGYKYYFLGQSPKGGGQSVHFSKFLMLRFSKVDCSSSFHSISTKFYGKYGNQAGIRLLVLLGNLPNLKKNLWHFEIFVNTSVYYRAENLLLQFSSDVGQTPWGHFLPWWNTDNHFSWQWRSFQNFVALWNSNMGVNGKS